MRFGDHPPDPATFVAMSDEEAMNIKSSWDVLMSPGYDLQRSDWVQEQLDSIFLHHIGRFIILTEKTAEELQLEDDIHVLEERLGIMKQGSQFVVHV